MPAPTGSIINRRSSQIEEIINRNLDLIVQGQDPAWRETFVSNQGVMSDNVLGRDYLYYKVYGGSYAGVVDGALMTDEFTLYGDKNANDLAAAKFFTQGVTQTFPDPTDSPNYSPYVLKVGLRGRNLTIPFTLGMMRAEATKAFIGEVINPMLKGVANNLAQLYCNDFYVNQNNGYALAQVSSASAVSGSGPYYITFTPSNYAYDRFRPGMRVDIYTNSSGPYGARKNDTQASLANQTVSTRVPVFVAAVDALRGTVTLVTNTSAFAFTGGTIANNDWIVPANSRLSGSTTTGTTGGFSTVAGINSWMKFGTGTSGNRNDDQLLGAEAIGSVDNGIIDVVRHPEFKSLLSSLGGAALTEHTLRKIVRRFHAAKNPLGQYIDTFIASDGVWLAYESTKIGFTEIERQGRLSSLNSEGSESGFTFTFEGRTYKGMTSTYIESGTMYGIRKGGNNWKRLVPPNPAGAKSMEGVDSFLPVRLLTEAITGGASRLPYYATANNRTLPTEMSMIVGTCYMQLVPEQPAGIKLTNVAEDRTWADAAYS